MSIVLDAMGSDQFPLPEIHAAIDLAASGEKVILVGKAELISQKSKEMGVNLSDLEIIDAPDIVDMDDKPVESFRQKPNNSMIVGQTLVKNGNAEAFVTAGNTGAAFFDAVKILGRIKGISRPALAAVLPVKNGRCVFMDTGANADCRPEYLLEFAVMGSVYAGILFNKAEPKVALLSNGEESSKGNQLVKDAFPMLENSGLNFVGNVEPKEIYAGSVDCVVTDGFSGNVFLKSSEAVGKLITETLKTSIMSSMRNKIGYLFIKPAINDLKKMMDPSEAGAAILLGVNGLVFIGHGRSDARALVSAVKLARRTLDANLMSTMLKEIEVRISSNTNSQD